MTFADHGIHINRDHGQVKTTCPKCSPTRRKHKDPCLSVDIDERVWNCHHCGFSGSLKEKREVRQISKATRPEMKPTDTEINPPSTSLSEKVLEWFEGRGIPETILQRNGIGYECVFMPGAGGEVNAIAFPYFKGGLVVNVKHRDSSKNFRQVKDGEKVFYGLDDVDGEEAIIVEGEMDKLSIEAAGFKNCLSVPDGAPSPTAKNYEAKFSYLEACSDLLNRLKKIIIAVDSDAPGRKLEEELIRRLGPEKCWRVTWPEGCKDANDVLVKHGNLALADCIEKAAPVPVAGLYEVRDIAREIESLYAEGTARGLSTGFVNLDEYYTIRPGEWTAVTGIPSHGKSEFVDAFVMNMAEEHGWRFAICSPENQPLQGHFAKLASKYLRKPFYDGPTQRMTREELSEAKEWIGDHFVFLLPPDDELTVDGVLSKARVAVMRYGIRGLVLDPWNELDHSRPTGMTETEYISSALTKIRRFARSNGVHVWLVAHPTKLQKDVGGNYPVPSMYDISGSAHWRNKADNGLSVWRDPLDDSKGVQVHVQKVRFKEVGKPGRADFHYDIATGCYRSC